MAAAEAGTRLGRRPRRQAERQDDEGEGGGEAGHAVRVPAAGTRGHAPGAAVSSAATWEPNRVRRAKNGRSTKRYDSTANRNAAAQRPASPPRSAGPCPAPAPRRREAGEVPQIQRVAVLPDPPGGRGVAQALQPLPARRHRGGEDDRREGEALDRVAQGIAEEVVAHREARHQDARAAATTAGRVARATKAGPAGERQTRRSPRRTGSRRSGTRWRRRYTASRRPPAASGSRRSAPGANRRRSRAGPAPPGAAAAAARRGGGIDEVEMLLDGERPELSADSRQSLAVEHREVVGEVGQRPEDSDRIEPVARHTQIAPVIAMNTTSGG